MKELIASKGWSFKSQEVAGFIFEKESESLIVSSRMWTRNYVLFQVEKEWNEKS